MVNQGVSPLLPSTLVGQLRGLIGDITAKPLEPALPGYGDYFYFSDDELLAFLAQGSESVPRAAGYAFLQLAAAEAKKAVNATAPDVKADTTKRSQLLNEVAKTYFEQADGENERELAAQALAASNDSYFAVIDPRADVVTTTPSAAGPSLIEDPNNPGYWKYA